MQARLRFELLGIPVRIEIQNVDPVLISMIKASYSFPLLRTSNLPLPVNPPETDEVVASLVMDDTEEYSVAVSGRESTRVQERILAVRALNHELLHSIMLRANDFFYVHAGVVAFGDRALVLPGLSRAGKSTLTLALASSGARFLSDELLVFDPKRGVAVPFPRSPKIRDECVDYFSDLAEDFVGTGEARFLPITEEGPILLAGIDPVIHTIVLPRWREGGTESLSSVSQGESLLHLTASALNFGTHRLQSLDHLSSLVSNARCFRLDWTHPFAASRALIQASGIDEIEDAP